MKFIIFFSLFVFFINCLHHLPASVILMKKLHVYSAECNFHGVYYDNLCYCYTDYIGNLCSQKITPGYYNTDDKCDDLLSRVDHLLNISPDKYELDDDEFPRLTGNSIGEEKILFGAKSTSWIRMHDMTTNFTIFPEKFGPEDLRQGNLGDGYLIAALISLTTIRNGQIIKDAFITKKDNSRNVYIVRWLIDGKPRMVAVDDWIPGTDGIPMGSRLGTNNAFWPLIIEKAWAKIYGSYSLIQGGEISEIMHSLTQAPVFLSFLRTFKPNDLWIKINDLISKNYPINFGSPSSTGGNAGYPFAVLGTYEVTLDNGSKARLVRIMNTFSKDNFDANRWKDTSTLWTEKVRKQVPWVNTENDGIFFVLVEDLMKHYYYITWCEVQKGYDSEYQDIAFITGVGQYSTRFTYENDDNTNTIYISIDKVNKRMILNGCVDPFVITKLTVIDPNGNTFAADDKTFIAQIPNAKTGTYVVNAFVVVKKSYTPYFTINAYGPENKLKFIPLEKNEIIYKNVTCPKSCSSHGRCNYYNGVCTCYEGFKGSDCSINKNPKPCKNNCSSAGDCDPGTGFCTCKQNYYGDDCSQKIINCPKDCNGHGNCNTTVGVCNCNPGFTDLDCSKVLLSCPNNCSSHGKCDTSIGACTCDEEYHGVDCAKKHIKCPNNCSSNGICDTSIGLCTCDKGFSGYSCEEKIYECLNNCTGNGVCDTHTGNCSCSLGFIGKDCSQKYLECPNKCSNNGVCDTNLGVCNCNKGWNSTDCSQVYLECSNNCSGNGSCNFHNGKCTCNSGFSGDDCSLLYFECPNKCSFHGTCLTTTGTCNCFSEYSGKDCSNLKCPKDCSNQGDCDYSVGRCKCNKDYDGEDCSIKKIKCNNDCSGHGTCDEKGICHCDSNWVDYDCSKQKLNCINNCNQNGKCNYETGKCLCKEGFTGDDCYSRVCPNDCSSNGYCDSNKGQCSCYSGFTGLNCAYLENGCPNACNGNGRCHRYYQTCHCDKGFSGLDCSFKYSKTCPNECSNNGICDYVTGKCTCNDGFTGNNCAFVENGCPGACNGHGRCHRYYQKCHCDLGFSGEDCADTS